VFTLGVAEEEATGEVVGLVHGLKVGEPVGGRLGFALELAEGDVEGDVVGDEVDVDVVDAVGTPITSSLPSNTVTYPRSLVNVPSSTAVFNSTINSSTINCDDSSPSIGIRIGTR